MSSHTPIDLLTGALRDRAPCARTLEQLVVPAPWGNVHTLPMLQAAGDRHTAAVAQLHHQERRALLEQRLRHLEEHHRQQALQPGDSACQAPEEQAPDGCCGDLGRLPGLIEQGGGPPGPELAGPGGRAHRWLPAAAGRSREGDGGLRQAARAGRLAAGARGTDPGASLEQPHHEV